MSYGTTKENAERACVHLNAHPLADAEKPTSRYIVARYPTPFGRYAPEPHAGVDFRHDFGVVRKWRYADRADLGEFGGEFVDLKPEMSA